MCLIIKGAYVTILTSYYVRALLQRVFPYLDLLSQAYISYSWTEISP